MKSITCFLLFALLFPAFSQNSILSTGDWYKISTAREGIYKIDADFLNSIGNFTNVDPRTIQLFGNGGKRLPQRNSETRPQDLTEIAIEGFGTDDGSLDAGDYFLFYAPTTDSITLSMHGSWSYRKHFYSEKNYFFITHSTVTGKRIHQAEQPAGSYELIDTYSPVTIIDENNLTLLNPGSGRNRYSFMSGRQISYNLTVPGLKDSVSVTIKGGANSDREARFEVLADGRLIDTIQFNGINQGTYSVKLDEESKEMRFAWEGSSLNLDVRLLAEGNGEVLNGYIDYLIVSYNSIIDIGANPAIIEDKRLFPGGLFSFSVQNAGSNTGAWDVSNILAPRSIPITSDGSEANVEYAVDNETPRVIIFKANQILSPTDEGKVANQNMRGASHKDGLIITHSIFLTEAQRLANFHRQHDGFDIGVYTVKEVYNEFSGGVPDITALRDATRYFYLKNPGSFRYLLLFGDCSYDYLDYTDNNTNFVPTYQSRNSIDPVLSYASDDYFGFMEADEGEWVESPTGDHTLDIGVGRIAVTKTQDARNVVDKIVRYSTSDRLQGKWKNRVTYVVDDGDGNLHMEDAEDFSEYFATYKPQLSVKKLYLDRYTQVIEGNNEVSPEANREFLQTINEEGTFIVNFIGHGDESRWMDETLLDQRDIISLRNKYKLPIFITATCEFGRYDNPVTPYSGAERLLVHPDGGAIALLTTARPVYASSNYFLNAAFHSYFFEKENGKLPRLGDIVRKTKNASLRGARNRNFTLLGDPFLKPAFADYEIEFEDVNGQPFEETDTLSALEKVQIGGRIVDLSGNALEDFQGTIDIRILDRKTERKTKGQENPPFIYTIQDNVIFSGKSTVTAGRFQTEFIVPQNISYRYEHGKIEAYAVAEDLNIDASSASRSIRIGGSADMTATEEDPPEITLWLNDSSFTDGGKVGKTAMFIAKVKDESGINTTGIGLAQNIELTLSDGRSYILNNYYTADIDTYKSGTVTFPLADLEQGRYEATFKIFDVHNNVATKSVSFVVSDKPEILLFDVKNYPNPVFDSKTAISFGHDRSEEDLQVQVLMYDTDGSEVKSFSFDLYSNSDGKDEIELFLPNGAFKRGLYFYRLIVRSTRDGAIGEQIGKVIKQN